MRVGLAQPLRAPEEVDVPQVGTVLCEIGRRGGIPPPPVRPGRLRGPDAAARHAAGGGIAVLGDRQTRGGGRRLTHDTPIVTRRPRLRPGATQVDPAVPSSVSWECARGLECCTRVRGCRASRLSPRSPRSSGRRDSCPYAETVRSTPPHDLYPGPS